MVDTWVPAEHGPITRLSEDTFLVAEPPYVHNRDRQLDWANARLAPYAYGRKWGIVARGGTWIMRPTFAQVSLLSDDLSGFFWATNSANMSAQWQLMGPDGTPAGTELFNHVQQIQRGQERAIVQRGGRWGAVDGKGKIVVELKFDWLGYFRDGWAPYRLAGREGRIDRNGTILTDATAQPSTSDGKLASMVEDKPLYTDRAGTTLLGTDHPKCPDGRHLRFDQGRWTIVTADDRPSPDISFNYVQLACNGPSIVEHDGKWGFISSAGQLLANRYFDRADAFHDGIAIIQNDGQWAVIAEDGSFLLGPLKLARGTFVSGTGEYGLEFEEGYRKLDKALIAELARNPEVLTRRLPPPLLFSEGLAAKFDDKTNKWVLSTARENSSSRRNSTQSATSIMAPPGRHFRTAASGARSIGSDRSSRASHVDATNRSSSSSIIGRRPTPSVTTTAFVLFTACPVIRGTAN